MGKLSVIIPFYKGKDYIENTVSCIMNLTCDFEVIIVDDGSPDNGYNYCKEIFQHTSNIEVVKKENGGVASARNYGMKIATGDYILFVDQDDSIDPENISTVVRLLDDNPEVDIVQYSTDVGCDEKRISCDQVYVEGIVSSKEVKNKIIPSMLMCEPCEWVSYTGHLWAIVFRYKFISKNLLTFKYFIDYEDDYLFVFDALCKCNLVYYYKSTGYHWNENLNSYSYNAKSINDYIVRADKRDAYLKEKATGIVDEKLLDSLLIYMTQKTIIDSFLNCCNNGIINHEALNNIILYLKKSNYHSAAYKEKILIRDHRYRFMLYVLRLFRVRVTAVAFKLYGISKQWRQSRDRKSM